MVLTSLVYFNSAPQISKVCSKMECYATDLTLSFGLKENKKSDFSLFFQFENVSKKRVFSVHTLEKERTKKGGKEKHKQRKKGS